jgi:hypothetical protein
MQSFSIGLVGRDLINLHNCTCSNTEATFRTEDGTDGAGNRGNWNVGRTYPASATLTAEVNVTF